MRRCIAALKLCLLSIAMIALGAVQSQADDHCPAWALQCSGEASPPVVFAAARHRAGGSVSTAGLPGPLLAAIAQVQRACPGFRVISTFRRNARVRGSGRRSLHAVGRAADIAGGSYACAYAALKGFAGGVSTDAGRVRHIHLSWSPGGQEWGARFRHYRGPARRARRAGRR